MKKVWWSLSILNLMGIIAGMTLLIQKAMTHHYGLAAAALLLTVLSALGFYGTLAKLNIVKPS